MNRDLFYQAANARALGSDRVPEVWSVSQLNAVARELLEGSLPPLWVAGEIADFRRMSAGHCFFTLKDARAKLSCVMWRTEARRLPTDPPEGMAVHVFGYSTVYDRAGRFQFVARELSARGAGTWRAAFERIRRRLEADGLLDPARKRPLPTFPRCVGVVTSRDGAALRDVASVVRRRAPGVDIVIYPTRVQGEGAAAEIADAIRYASSAVDAEVLIVGRGGGSADDLWAFNDERVARAIGDSPIPVISAVGHETDVTLADLVADSRAATPSAAAEAAVPEWRTLQDALQKTRNRIASALRTAISSGARRLEGLEERLTAAMRSELKRRRLGLDAASQRLDALGPLAVLRRGYAVPLDPDGRILRGVDAFEGGNSFRLRLHDGHVDARVTDVSAED